MYLCKQFYICWAVKCGTENNGCVFLDVGLTFKHKDKCHCHKNVQVSTSGPLVELRKRWNNTIKIKQKDVKDDLKCKEKIVNNEN